MEKNNMLRQMMKTRNIKGKLLSNQIATRKKKKLGRLSLHENWTRTFVLQISMCFSRHIALVCKGLNININKTVVAVHKTNKTCSHP